MPDGAITASDVGFAGPPTAWFLHRRAARRTPIQRLRLPKYGPVEVEDVIYTHPAVRRVRGDRSARRDTAGKPSRRASLAERGASVTERKNAGQVLHLRDSGSPACKYPRRGGDRRGTAPDGDQQDRFGRTLRAGK